MISHHGASSGNRHSTTSTKRKLLIFVGCVVAISVVLGMIHSHPRRTVHILPRVYQDALPYDLYALEPHISGETMHYHYNELDYAYDKKLQAAVSGTKFETMSPLNILIENETQSSQVPVDMANWAGQIVNHNIFWKSMTPNQKTQAVTISAKLKGKINTDYNNFDVFGNTVITKAKSIFGAGWTWVVYNSRTNKIDVLTTHNGDYPTPIADLTVLFNIDIWEHSYYLDYATNREEYVKNVLAVLNWEHISDVFEQAAATKKDPENH